MPSDETSKASCGPKPIKKRTSSKRASAACHLCRQRHVQCHTSPGDTKCTTCQQFNAPCVFNGQDHRKILHSRAHTADLTKRVALLEKTLQNHGITIATEEQPGLTPPTSIPSIATTPKEARDSKLVCCEKGFPGWQRLLEPFSPLLRIKTPNSQSSDKALQFLHDDTYNYLMDLFWGNFNSVIPLMCSSSFETRRRDRDPRYYSSFLHTCMLAIGYRYSDKSRPDIQVLSLANRESVFHREARQMLDDELELEASVPLVIALLLLGDLEWAMGREKQSWLLGRMAVRSAKEAEIDQDADEDVFPMDEILSRRRALQACILYDRMWGLLLGHERYSNHINIGDEPTDYCRRQSMSYEESIFVALTQLTRLTCEQINIPNSMSSRNHNAHLEVIHLLEQWRKGLTDGSEWIPKNVAAGNASFFLLHQQYHANILSTYLYASRSGETFHSDATSHAIWIARILQYYRCRSKGKCLFTTALIHTGLAIKGLLLGLRHTADRILRNEILFHLGGLLSLLTEMSESFASAEHMSSALRAALASWHNTQDEKSFSISTEWSTKPESVTHAMSISDYEDIHQSIEDNPSFGNKPFRNSYESGSNANIIIEGDQSIEDGVNISTESWQVLMTELNAGMEDGTIWSGACTPR